MIAPCGKGISNIMTLIRALSSTFGGGGDFDGQHRRREGEKSRRDNPEGEKERREGEKEKKTGEKERRE